MSYLVTETDVTTARDTVVDIWKRNLPGQASAPIERVRGKYEWFYRNNPVREGRVWLIAKDGVPVGTAGVGYRKITVFGREILSGIAADMAVDVKHRALGPALMLQRAVYALTGGDVDAIYAMPNPGATVAMKRIGYVELGGLFRYVRILRLAPYLQKKLKSKALASVLALPLDLSLRLISKETRVGLPGGCKLVSIDRFDHRFDAVWEAMPSRFPIIANRDYGFLNWRFSGCPTFSYKTLALIDGNDAPLGYVVYYHAGNGAVELVDIAYGGDERTPDILLSAFIKRMYAEGAASIFFHFFGSSAFKRKLAEFKFSRRQDSIRFAVATGNDKELQEALKDEENWFLTSGDMDNN